MSVSLIDGHIDGMTDNEIIKALECHIGKDDKRCKHCAYTIYGCNCLEKLLFALYDLINRKDAEIERLHEVINGFEEQSHKDLLQLCELSEKYENAQAEIEQWKEEANKYQSLWCEAVTDIQNAKSEAIKEFTKEFEKRCIAGGIYPAFVKRKLNDVKKEMMGDADV